MEKTVLTLGERLAADSQRLTHRYRSSPAWLDLLTPVVERTAALAKAIERFERRDAVPRREPPPPLLLTEAPAQDEGEATLVWPEIGRPVAAEVRDSLRPLIGPEIDRARLHTDAAADALARSRRADAVTIGADVHFREGAFDPDSPKGLGLLAHELTHVAASLAPGADWRRADASGVRAEEALAHGRERGAARAAIDAQLPARSPLAAPAPVPAAPAPQARPMLAETDRPPPAPPPTAAQPNFDQLRDGLYRDIMARIRVDFERGG